MSIIPGHGLLLKGFFANGVECSYPRPFIVIECTDTNVKALNVSSLHRKEHKLMMKSNKKINYYKPPFHRESFVKLDELYEFEKCAEISSAIMKSGELNSDSLTEIQSWFKQYQENYRVSLVSVSRRDFLVRNGGNK